MRVTVASQTLSSPEKMVQFGEEMAQHLVSPLTLALKGDLGSGKTTFLKGFISFLTQIPPRLIQSPTFTYLQIYEGIFPIFHFDLYRLQHYEQFEAAGFSDYLNAGGICCLEWAERIEQRLPKTTTYLEISFCQDNLARHCEIYRNT